MDYLKLTDAAEAYAASAAKADGDAVGGWSITRALVALVYAALAVAARTGRNDHCSNCCQD